MNRGYYFGFSAVEVISDSAVTNKITMGPVKSEQSKESMGFTALSQNPDVWLCFDHRTIVTPSGKKQASEPSRMRAAENILFISSAENQNL